MPRPALRVFRLRTDPKKYGAVPACGCLPKQSRRKRRTALLSSRDADWAKAERSGYSVAELAGLPERPWERRATTKVVVFVPRAPTLSLAAFADCALMHEGVIVPAVSGHSSLPSSFSEASESSSSSSS